MRRSALSEYPKHERLLADLRAAYAEKFPRSGVADARARRVMTDGISHGARLFAPYPFRVADARDGAVTAIDGQRIVDFWQGHYANILGHNPAVVREALIAELERGGGLQTGLPEERQIEYAERLAAALGAEQIRMTTAGTLATMYAIMLARAYTGRQVVLKLAGGWHGANPLALKGVNRTADGFTHADSAGVPTATTDEIMVTRFNDVEALEAAFRQAGDRIACLIFEPCLGGAGFIPASSEFMAAARALTQRYGALLIIDEVITGFRFCAGGAQRLYGVTADLSTYGKVIGGGMPISAVAGRADVMALAGQGAEPRVAFNGGTFSEHPLSVLAGLTMITYLQQHEDEIYPALAARGEELRRGIERVFADRGVLARCTGHGNEVVKGGSLANVYFPRKDGFLPMSSEDFTDPQLNDVILREQALKVGLLLDGVNVVHGLGSLATSHTDADLQQTYAAYDAFALRLRAEV